MRTAIAISAILFVVALSLNVVGVAQVYAQPSSVEPISDTSSATPLPVTFTFIDAAFPVPDAPGPVYLMRTDVRFTGNSYTTHDLSANPIFFASDPVSEADTAMVDGQWVATVYIANNKPETIAALFLIYNQEENNATMLSYITQEVNTDGKVTAITFTSDNIPALSLKNGDRVAVGIGYVNDITGEISLHSRVQPSCTSPAKNIQATW